MKKILAAVGILVFILFTVHVSNSASYYPRAGNAQRYSSGGQVLVSSSAQVWVYQAGTSDLATLYSNSTGSSQTNPVIADRYGNYSYYAGSGRYDEVIVGPAGTSPVNVYSVGIGAGFSSAMYVDTIDYATLAEAASVAATLGKGVLVSNSVATITSGLTVTVPVQIVKGGMLTTTATVTIEKFSAPRNQVFIVSGAGKFMFSSGAVDEVFPEWSGAKGDGSTDDTAAIQAAINQAAYACAVLKFASKQYNYSKLYLYYDAVLNPNWPYDGVAGYVKYKNTITIEGTTREERPQYNASQKVGTILYSTYTGTNGTIIKDVPSGESSWFTTSQFHIKNLTVISNNPGYVLDLRYFNQHSSLENVYVQQNNASGSGIYFSEAYVISLKNCTVMGPEYNNRAVTGIRVYNEAVSGGIIKISEGTTVRNFATGIDIGGHTYNDGIAGQVQAVSIVGSEVADYDVGIILGWNVINASIRDSYFEHTAGQSGTDTIRIAYGAVNVSVEDSFFSADVTSSQIYVGYNGNPSYGVFIKNNNIRCRDAVSAYGIYINSTSPDPIIFNNRFVPNVAGSTNTTGIYTGTAGQSLTKAIVFGNSFNTIVNWVSNYNGLKIGQDGYGNMVQGIFGLTYVARNVEADGSVSTSQISSVAINPSATPITSFTLESNKILIARFVGANTLVHSATLQLRGGVNYTTTDGTVKIFYCPLGTYWIEIPNGPEPIYSAITSSPTYTGQMAVVSGAAYLATGNTSTANWKQSTAEVFYTQATPSTSVTGTTVETTLWSTTIPGGSIGANGTMEVEALLTVTGSANAKTIQAKFGSTVVIWNATSTASIVTMRPNALVVNNGSESSQIIHTNAIIWPSSVVIGSATEASAGDLTLSITGTLASAGETITLRYVGITIKRGD